MDTNRNLLFGVLAMQAGLIAAAQFVQVCTLWTTRKNTALGDLLVGRGWILPVDRDHLHYLLRGGELQMLGGNARASLAGVPGELKLSLAALGD